MKSNKEVIIEFLTEMSKQNNRATAAPYYYALVDDENNERGIFLTEKDGKRALESFGPKAYLFVKHACRADDLKRFLTALFNEYGIPRGNSDLMGVKE